MANVIDAYSAGFESAFGWQTETAELIAHTEPYFFAIKIWRNNVLPASETRPSQVHVGQEKYIKRLWRGYKTRRGVLFPRRAS